MSTKPFFIGPIKTGMEKDLEPFLLPNDAFVTLEDCYLFRGRIERRVGNAQLGRLVESIVDGALGNTGASPFVINLITTFPAAALGIQPGSVTVNIAAPVGPLVYVDSGAGTLNAGGGNTGTIDYVSGALSLIHPAAAASVVTVTFSFYTGRPVMGLRTRETVAINQEDLIAFDTEKANIFDFGANRFEDISFDTLGNVIQWTGADDDFFWSTNYYTEGTNKLFWATNNVQNSIAGPIVQDGIQIYNGTGWALQTPRLTTLALNNRFLNGCLILIPYRNRMVALNTLESAAPVGVVAQRHSNRARWCQNGVPYTNTLLGADSTSWDDVTPGKGGYVDAPTSEEIISCGFFKDTLIVFFERSTWALVYTANEVIPFIWQRVNSEFGAESTFSIIPFDKGLFAVGDKGIVIADSTTVERIDQKIPDEVFGFHNQNNGPQRVHGIRDYYFQFAYWTFPAAGQNRIYPDRLLLLNYLEGSYSIFNDSYTCLGYCQYRTDRTWATTPAPWDTVGGTWFSARNQSEFPLIVGGNQQGFVMVFDQKIPNGKSLYITAITQAAQASVTSPDHNLEINDFVTFSDLPVGGMIEINNLVGKVVNITNADEFLVDIDSSLFTAYTRSGFITVHNNINITTKKFNPFFSEGKKTRMNYLDVYVEKTAGGQFQIDVFGDDANSQALETDTIVTTQNYGPALMVGKMWQRVYLDVSGQFLQFKFYLNDADMRNQTIRDSNIVIHGMIPWMMPVGRLFSYDRPIP
jgi:hypothetical protein